MIPSIYTANDPGMAGSRIALQRRARRRGKDRVGWQFTLAAAAYNLIRLPKLLTT